MGACGCGDYNGYWRIPGPDGKWYVIGPYGGCNNGCETPVGLSVDLMDEKELRNWHADELPIIGGPDHPNFGIPLVHPTKLAEAVFNRLDECGVNVGEDEYDRNECVDEFDARSVLLKATKPTLDEFDTEVKKSEMRK